MYSIIKHPKNESDLTTNAYITDTSYLVEKVRIIHKTYERFGAIISLRLKVNIANCTTSIIYKNIVNIFSNQAGMKLTRKVCNITIHYYIHMFIAHFTMIYILCLLWYFTGMVFKYIELWQQIINIHIFYRLLLPSFVWVRWSSCSTRSDSRMKHTPHLPR